MASSNKTVFPLPVGADRGGRNRVRSCNIFHRIGWTHRSLPSADVMIARLTETECRKLTTFSPELRIYDRYMSHPAVERTCFLTVSKQLDCIALKTPNLNMARYISAMKRDRRPLELCRDHEHARSSETWRSRGTALPGSSKPSKLRGFPSLRPPFPPRTK
jgi:hypothetical protein